MFLKEFAPLFGIALLLLVSYIVIVHKAKKPSSNTQTDTNVTVNKGETSETQKRPSETSDGYIIIDEEHQKKTSLTLEKPSNAEQANDVMCSTKDDLEIFKKEKEYLQLVDNMYCIIDETKVKNCP